MTRKDRNDYMREWRKRQTPEKQEQIRQKIRECNAKRRDELNAIRKVRYYENPERHNAVVQQNVDRIKADPALLLEWRNKRRRHKRERVRGITEAQWNSLLDLTGWRCVYCLRPFSDDLPPEPDHIISLRNGGERAWGNIAPCCRSCNARKQNKSVGTFMAQLHADSLPK